MKPFVAAVALFVITGAHASGLKAPSLPSPAPYGAYFVDRAKQSPAEYKASLDAIARHYGYKDDAAAAKACVAATRNPFSCVDSVEHRRNESSEIAQFGFKTWNDAVFACNKNFKPGELGPYTYCLADPFLKLRTLGK